MNISLLEPIGVPEEMINRLAEGLRKEGHVFTYYDTKTTDVEELKRRSAGQEIFSEFFCLDGSGFCLSGKGKAGDFQSWGL